MGADATYTRSPGVTLEQIASRSGYAAQLLELVLREEAHLGRVSRNGSGSYALVASAFEPKLLDSFARL